MGKYLALSLLPFMFPKYFLIVLFFCALALVIIVALVITYFDKPERKPVRRTRKGTTGRKTVKRTTTPQVTKAKPVAPPAAPYMGKRERLKATLSAQGMPAPGDHLRFA